MAAACNQAMADGRSLTDLSSRCAQLKSVQDMSGTVDAYDMRQYLVANADAVMQAEREAAAKRTGMSCPGTMPSAMLAEAYAIVCTPQGCEHQLRQPDGLGDGRANTVAINVPEPAPSSWWKW
jgi:hypothetical protein